jgi:sugar/nucleoside kinase (ribokinase family)
MAPATCSSARFAQNWLAAQGLAAAARFGQAAAALAISRPPEAREALTEDAVRRLSAQSGG